MENKKISNKNISDKEFFERCQSSEHWSCITTFIFGILASIFLFFCLSIIGIALYAITSINLFWNPVTSCIVFVLVLVKMEHGLFKDLKNNKNERKKLCVELGISEDDCANSYKKLIKILPYITYLSIAQQMCKLNTNASQNQEEVLKGFFCIDNATIKKYVFEKEYTKEELEFYAQHSKENKLYENKAFIDRLFKLAIVQDGIHNDEWQLLMQTLADLKFNKNNINLFTKRYGPLRTEFEDDHNNGRNNDHKEDRKEDSSTKVHSVNALNPYYAILGLDSNATDNDIKRAYHNLALQHHPDLPKNAGRIQECEEMMAKINEAYEKVRG